MNNKLCILLVLAVSAAIFGCGKSAADRIDDLAREDDMVRGEINGSTLDGSSTFNPQRADVVLQTGPESALLTITMTQWTQNGSRTIKIDVDPYPPLAGYPREISAASVACGGCDLGSACQWQDDQTPACIEYYGPVTAAATNDIPRMVAELSEPGFVSVPYRTKGYLHLDSLDMKESGNTIAGNFVLSFEMPPNYSDTAQVEVLAEFVINSYP